MPKLKSKRVPLCAPVRMTPLRPAEAPHTKAPREPHPNDDKFWLAQYNREHPTKPMSIKAYRKRKQRLRRKSEPGDQPTATEAMERIRRYCSLAIGNKDAAVKNYMREVVHIVEDGDAPENWRAIVEAEYPIPKMMRLLDECFARDVYGRSRKPTAVLVPLTDAQCALIHKYDSLLRSAARKRASGLDGTGKKTLNDILFDELATIGLEVLESEVRKFDPTLGVTFGTAVRKRLNGAMDNYLTRERIETVPYDEATLSDDASKGDHRNGALARSRDQWKSEGQERDAKGKMPRRRTKRCRDSTGAYKGKPLGASRDKGDRLTQTRDSAAKLDRVLAMLPANEQLVYRARVMQAPPRTQRALAEEMGVTHTWVAKLEKIARKKVESGVGV